MIHSSYGARVAVLYALAMRHKALLTMVNASRCAVAGSTPGDGPVAYLQLHLPGTHGSHCWEVEVVNHVPDARPLALKLAQPVPNEVTRYRALREALQLCLLLSTGLGGDGARSRACDMLDVVL